MTKTTMKPVRPVKERNLVSYDMYNSYILPYIFRLYFTIVLYNLSIEMEFTTNSLLKKVLILKSLHTTNRFDKLMRFRFFGKKFCVKRTKTQF